MVVNRFIKHLEKTSSLSKTLKALRTGIGPYDLQILWSGDGLFLCVTWKFLHVGSHPFF